MNSKLFLCTVVFLLQFSMACASDDSMIFTPYSYRMQLSGQVKYGVMLSTDRRNFDLLVPGFTKEHFDNLKNPKSDLYRAIESAFRGYAQTKPNSLGDSHDAWRVAVLDTYITIVSNYDMNKKEDAEKKSDT